MKIKKILYIGNNLVKKTNYNNSMATISGLMHNDGFVVIKKSSIGNKFFRILDMIFSVIIYRRKVDYLLIDTFSTSNFYYALITSQIARFFKLKYIPILHGGNLPYRLDNSKQFSNLIFNNSYKNVAPSNYLKKEFEQRNYKTILIPNVLEIDDYVFKKRENIQPKILWVRAFKNLYNPTLAIKVLRLVKKKFPTATLCMVGPIYDASFQRSKNLAEKYKLENSVEFTGVLLKEEWHKKSQNYDIFINTTNFDNTPVSIIEAMALGLTIVSTRVGGMPYLIDNNINGILVDKENAHQMANAIIKLITENNQELSKNARLKAESFGWNVVKMKWYSILK